MATIRRLLKFSALCGLLLLSSRAAGALTASPTSVTVPKTTLGPLITVTLTFGTGFSGTGTLSITGLPPGAVTVPSPVTYPYLISSTSATTSFRIGVSAATSPGTYTVTITDPPLPTGRSAGVKTIVLVVPAPSVMSATPSAVSIYPTQTSGLVSVGISYPAATGSGTATLGVSGLPAGVTTTPSSVSYTYLTGSTSATTSFRFVATAAAAPGTSTVTLSDPAPPGGRGPSLVSVTLTVLTPSFTATASPNPVTLTAGIGTQTVTVFTVPDPGLSGTLTYSFAGLPSGISTGGLRTASSPYGAVTFPFSASAAMAAGTYSGTLTGVSAFETKTFPISVVVQKPDVSVSLSPPSLSVCNGGPSAASSTIITPLTGYVGTPSLSFSPVTGLSISPSPLVSPPLPPAQTIPFLVSASGASPGPQTMTLTVTDASLGLSRTASLAVMVTNPDFTPAVTPGALTLQAGATPASFTASLTPVSCFAPASLTIGFSGAPGGLTVTPPSATVTGPGWGPASFSVLAGAALAPAAYPLTVTFTPSSGPPHTFPVTVTVTAAPDFSLSASPSTLTLLPGGSATTAVQATGLNGFSGTISVTAPTLSDVTFTPSSFTLTPGSTRAVTVAAAAAATPASLAAAFTGTASGITGSRSGGLTVVIIPPPDFSLSVSPALLGITAGSSGSVSVLAAGLNGFSGPISVTAPSIPNVTFTPASFTLTPGSSQAVSVAAAAGAAAGTLGASFSGTAAGVSGPRTGSFTLEIRPPPDFAITASPTSLTLAPGSTGTVSVSAAGLNGFAGTISVTTSAPAGVTPTPASFALSPGASQSVTLAVAAAASPGDVTLLFSGSAAGVTGARTALVALHIVSSPDVSLGVAPGALTLEPGHSDTAVVTATGLNGFSGTVAVTAPTLAGISFSPSSFSLPPSASQSVTVSVAPTAAAGTRSATFSGTAAGISGTRTATLSVTVVLTPDFSLAASPALVSIPPGGSAVATISATGINGFSGAIQVSAPSAASLSFAPASFTLFPGATQSVTITAAAGAPTGTTTVTFSGNAPGLTGTRTASLAVTVTSVPDFSLAVTPAALTLTPGSSGTAVVSVQPLNGFSAAVDVVVVPVANVTVQPAQFTIAPGSSQTLSFVLAAGAAASTVPVSISGTSPGIPGSRGTTLPLTIASGPDFSLSLTPASVSLSPGGTASTAVSVTSMNGFGGNVDVTASGPSGVSILPAVFPLAAGGSRSVTISAATTVSPGAVAVLFSGTAAAAGTRAVTLTANVTAAPDFSLAVTPPSVSLHASAEGAFQISLVPANGFAAEVDVSVAPPPGVTVAPLAFRLSPGLSQAVTVRVASGATPGTGSIAFHATSSAVAGIRTAAATVTVTRTPDFAFSVVPGQATLLAGEAIDLTALAAPVEGFTSDLSVTVSGLPVGAHLDPSPFLLTPGTPRFVTLHSDRQSPPGTYDLLFRAMPVAGAASPKNAAVSLRILPPSAGFTVSASPGIAQAAPGQAVAILYTFRNLTDSSITITGDTLVRRSFAGGEFDRTEEAANLLLPPRGTAILSNTVLFTAAQFAASGTPPVVVADRIFRAAPDPRGFVATASAAVPISAVNPLLSTLSATRVSLVYPPQGTLVGRGDALRAQGLVSGSGSGILLVGWFFDGLLVETASVPVQNGTPVSVSTGLTLPTPVAGQHEVFLSVLSPNTLASPRVQIVVDEQQQTLRLVAPAAGSNFLPGLSPPTFTWIPIPGIARYAIGLKREGAPEAGRRWFSTSATSWGPDAARWGSFEEGRWDWIVRGFTGLGRSGLESASGTVSMPTSSEPFPDVASGWTVSSAPGQFTVGDPGDGLLRLEGIAESSGAVARFSWQAVPGSTYLHVLYERKGPGLTRIDLALSAEPARKLKIPGPRGRYLWRVFALDSRARPVAATPLLEIRAGGQR